MQQAGLTAGWGTAGHKRVESVVETLANLRIEGENLAEVAHDARNMVTALGLYCDLLQEPGVLATPYAHYGEELRLVAMASRRLVEKLVALDTVSGSEAVSPRVGIGSAVGPEAAGVSLSGGRSRQTRPWEMTPAVLIGNLAAELQANRNLLAAVAGPTIALSVVTEASTLPVGLTVEDLTRVLVNLVKNAAEAMPKGGRIQLRLREQPADAERPQTLLLTIDDSGPGIPGDALDSVFEAGFSTRGSSAGNHGWAGNRRGLGLSITRAIVEKAGGRIFASNCDPGGARLAIELPVRAR
jgi:signal transduction histidine kinase